MEEVWRDMNNVVKQVFKVYQNICLCGDGRNDSLGHSAINPNKAMGLDHISPRDLKLCESSVVQGLFEICMKSRADCPFPISWKKSQETAAFKKGNRLDGWFVGLLIII